MAGPHPSLSLRQALIAQHDRLLKLTTILGDDMLLPQRVMGHDRLGRSYEYVVDTVSVRSDIELKKLIAQPVTLWIQQANRSYLPISGYVHTVKRLGSDGELTFCQLTFAPWLHFLRFRRDARLWQEKPADDILASVFAAHPQAQGQFRFEVRTPVLRRSYCTQYETDWHFVHRMMEEEGWYGYHEHKSDGSGHILVITDSPHQLDPLAQKRVFFHGGATDDEAHKIVHWSASRCLTSTRLTTQSDNYKSPNSSMRTESWVFPEHGDLPSQLEIYEYTGAYSFSKHDQGVWRARVRIEQWESSMKRFYGVSSTRSMQPGRWFILEDHPVHRYDTDEDREFMIIAVDWCIENNLPLSNRVREFPGSLAAQVEAFKESIGRDVQNGPANSPSAARRAQTGHCFNRFEVQRRKIPFRSPFEHPKPTLHPQTAVVVGPEGEEIFTDQLNRVKVRMRWDRINPSNERASCWVRVSYPNAGQHWGALNVPRIGQEVIVTFLNGDADRPVITGRLYNDLQGPQWHSNGRLSGFKSKEFEGSGFNQLVMDDTNSQNRVHLYSTNTHAQLNLGYLVSQSGNERRRFFGAGFALSTDDYGAIVTHKGLYISTYGRPGAQGTQLDAIEATTRLKAGASLTKALSDTACKAGADALIGQGALNHFIEATQERYPIHGQGDANRFKEAILLAASSDGLGLTSAKGTHVHAGEEVTVSSGLDTNIAVGRSLLASVAEKVSLFAANAGIKLFAAKGKVQVQAQSDDLDIIAEKVLRLLSTTSRVEIHAKDEVMLSAGGSSIRINASGVTESTSGTSTAHASLHTMLGPATSNYVMPHVEKAELGKTDLEFRHLTDWGAPLAGAAYKATLSDGSTREGTLDAMGIARISGMPAGAAAKIEYDYRPLDASSTVSVELDEDIDELLNWTAANASKKGGA